MLAAISLPLAIPLIGGLAAISAIRFRCNPFFVQGRAGIDEEPFRVTKIRSLPEDFPEVGKHDLDDRVICRWGQFLRDSHLDELPQVLNVLDGSMSLVGPRPMIPSVLDELSSRDRTARARVKPGLTGPWQVSSAGGGALQDCAWLDGRYVENGSMALDIRLLAMTASTIMGGTPRTPDELVDRFGWRSLQVVGLSADAVAATDPELAAG